jgi:ABC-type branched-subunit amino acid transport system ATPase component
MSGLLVDLQAVSKAYKYFALRDLQLQLQPGQIMGFVGPNGAGKSTTLKLLMALVHQDGRLCSRGRRGRYRIVTSQCSQTTQPGKKEPETGRQRNGRRIGYGDVGRCHRQGRLRNALT